MARTSDHGPSPWLAFVMGAVVMLLLALAWAAWWASRDGAELVRSAAEAAREAGELPRPRIPDAPRLPDAPVPRPK